MHSAARPVAALVAACCLSGPGVIQAADGPVGPPVLRSARSGPWSAASTWEGSDVPGAGARVLVRPGHRVVYDVKADAVVRGVCVAGTLSFAPDRDTVLNVGLLKVQPRDAYAEDGFDGEHEADARGPRRDGGHGEGHGDAGRPTERPALEVGTPERPIDAGLSAVIRLHYVEGMSKDDFPAVVCDGGRWESHGTPLSRAWVKLGADAKAGDAAVTLAEPVSGWRVGDRVIVTGTRAHGSKKEESLTEERAVAAVDGVRLTLDAPLAMPHLGAGEFRGEVANLSRNVVVESADPAGVRGHTMYHVGSAGSLAYTEFRHLGKRDTLGRYALHFHLCGETLRGSSVVGNAIRDSDNRWLTIHGTDGLVVRDNVGYGSVGHGFFLEDGTEVRNVLDRNLAVAAKPGKKLPRQVLPFDANEGAGFWWANSLNAFTRNVAVECGEYGFRYEATPTSALKLVFPVRRPDGTSEDRDVRTLPFVRFEGNEVHGSLGLYGVNLGEGVVRDLKIWDVHYAFRPQVPSLLVENLTIRRAAYGIYHPNFDAHVYRNVRIEETNTEPFNRGHDDLSVQHGMLAVDGLTFDGCRSGGMPLVQISDDNPTGAAESHFRNLTVTNWANGGRKKAIVNLGGGPRPRPKTEKGVPVFLHDWFGPGRHAEVASVRSPEYLRSPDRFREEPPLTGDESRVAEVRDVPFPRPLDPVDDAPPWTVVTHVLRDGRGGLTVRGTTADDGPVAKVTVGGAAARPTASNFAEWEIDLDAAAAGAAVTAAAEDAAGNAEPRPHVVPVPAGGSPSDVAAATAPHGGADSSDWVAEMKQVHDRFRGEPGTLALFGDSITVSLAFWAPLADGPAGLSPEAAEDLAVVKRHLRPEDWRGRRGPEYGSEGGATVRWAAGNVDAWLARTNPEAAVILFGTNDLTRLDADEYEAKLRDVVRRCLANGTVAILTTPPPRHGFEAKSAEFAEKVRGLSRELGVPVVDYHAEIVRRRPTDWDGASDRFRTGPPGGDEYDVPTLIARDGVHPSNPKAFRDYSKESLSRNGFALRNALTLPAYAEVVRRVLRP